MEKRRRERLGKKQRRQDCASEISLGRTGSSKDHCESARLEPKEIVDQQLLGDAAAAVGSVCLESKEIVDQQLLGDAAAAARRLLEKRRRERLGKKQRRQDCASEISLGRTGSSKDHCESARLEPKEIVDQQLLGDAAAAVGSVCLESKEIVDQQLLGDAAAAVELLAELRGGRRAFWRRRADERVNLLEKSWDGWIACAVLGTAAVHDENSDDGLLEQMIRTRTV